MGAYLGLLTDRYPSTVEEQSVHLELDYPDAENDLNQWLPLVKWFLAIPHYFVLAFLWLAVIFVTFIAWIAILFTGSYPRGMFDFVVGVARWTLRVEAYALPVADRRLPAIQPELGRLPLGGVGVTWRSSESDVYRRWWVKSRTADGMPVLTLARIDELEQFLLEDLILERREFEGGQQSEGLAVSDSEVSLFLNEVRRTRCPSNGN